MVKRLTELRRFAVEKMQKVNVFETHRFFCDLYCLLPGQSQKIHAHADSDKVYVVMEGQAQIEVGEQRVEAVAGEAVLAPAGQRHGVENAGPEPVVLLVFMAPHPDPPR